jgi:hypothetical protein
MVLPKVALLKFLEGKNGIIETLKLKFPKV